MECPVCQEEVAFETSQIWETLEVVCSYCFTSLHLKVVLEPAVSEHDASSPSFEREGPEEAVEDCIEPIPLEENIPDHSESQDFTKKVLLCLEGEATRELVETLLGPENIHLIHISAEMETLVSSDCPKPDIALIDMDVNQNPEIDLCAEMRKNAVFKDTDIIVIGSMFEKNTRYREHKPIIPGADAFIDRYFLKEELLDKVMNTKSAVSDHVDSEETEAADVQAPEHEMIDCEIKENTDTRQAPKEAVCEERLEDAQQVARNVVSEMIRCNAEKVEEGIRSGSLYDFLSDEIGESRRQYETRVSEATRSVSNYFEEILEEKLQERKSAQTEVQPAEDLRPLVHEIVGEETEIAEALESPDFPDAPADDFEVTKLTTEPMEEIDDFLPNADEPDLKIEANLETEGIEANSVELSRQDAVTEIGHSSLHNDSMPFFEEGPEGFETTSLVDEPISDVHLDARDFPPADEPTTAVSPVSDVIQEAEHLEEESPAIKTARRLARIIVSDIVIYNEKKVEEGIRTGQFFELLSEEIVEGRQLYHLRVDQNGLEKDYLQEALTDYVNKKTSVSPN